MNDQTPKFKSTKPRNPNWRLREERRFAEGYYKPVPWASEAWAKRQPDHFVHISRKHTDGSQIAYTPSPENGELDQQLTTKPGRYLKKHFGDILSDSQINRWTGALRGLDTAVMFTADPKVMADIYMRTGLGGGANACMSYGIGHYASSKFTKVHPVEGYCAGDIQLAWIEADKLDPNLGTKPIVARVLVWPARKIYSRPYGDFDRITYALQLQGYKPGILDGARLNPIPINTHEHKEPIFCGPFVDHMNWARYDTATNTLRLCIRATGATHSVQHSNGVIYPISSAPARAGSGAIPRYEHERAILEEAKASADGMFILGHALMSWAKSAKLDAHSRIAPPLGTIRRTPIIDDRPSLHDLIQGRQQMLARGEFLQATVNAPMRVSPNAPDTGWIVVDELPPPDAL